MENTLPCIYAYSVWDWETSHLSPPLLLRATREPTLFSGSGKWFLRKVYLGLLWNLALFSKLVALQFHTAGQCTSSAVLHRCLFTQGMSKVIAAGPSHSREGERKVLISSEGLLRVFRRDQEEPWLELNLVCMCLPLCDVPLLCVCMGTYTCHAFPPFKELFFKAEAIVSSLQHQADVFSSVKHCSPLLRRKRTVSWLLTIDTTCQCLENYTKQAIFKSFSQTTQPLFPSQKGSSGLCWLLFSSLIKEENCPTACQNLTSFASSWRWLCKVCFVYALI